MIKVIASKRNEPRLFLYGYIINKVTRGHEK